MSAGLQFETMLANLSARFVNVPADAVDDEIETGQRLVCELLGLDQSALWQWVDEDHRVLRMTNLYRVPGAPPVPELLDTADAFPWTTGQLLAGRVVVLPSMGDHPPEADHDHQSRLKYGIKSGVEFPLSAGGDRMVGVLTFSSLREELSWPDRIVQRLQLVAQIFANAIVRAHSEEALLKSYAEVKRLKRQIELENVYLKREYRLRHGNGRVVGESPAIMEVLAAVEQVAPTRSTVLIEGETGTGKELIAQRIHQLSPRRDRPMVKVNCASLPSTLVESELFGREKGAYTGAVSREPGRFEVANGSTIFLDEVAELALELQAKLLRVLEEGQFERVGSSRTLQTDVRVIAATNRDLNSEVAAGRFRRDLFYRLAVFPIRVPPLRDRREDVPLLVWAAVEEFSRSMNRSVESIPRQDLELLQRYDWPGNVRELRNLVERAMILASGPSLSLRPSPPAAWTDDSITSLDEAQRRQIAKALEAAGGRIAGRGGAAELLGLKPTTLRSKMQRLEMEPDRTRDRSRG